MRRDAAPEARFFDVGSAKYARKAVGYAPLDGAYPGLCGDERRPPIEGERRWDGAYPGLCGDERSGRAINCLWSDGAYPGLCGDERT